MMHKAHLIWITLAALLALDVTLALLKRFGITLPGIA